MSTPLRWPPDPDRAVKISPRVDIVFRELFGTPGHEPLLCELLNEVLTLLRPIARVWLLPDTLLPENIGNKATIIDVRATDDRGRSYQIEMQVNPQPALERRAVFGAAGLVRHQGKVGESYADMPDCISVWFCDHSGLKTDPGAADIPHHRRFIYREEVSGQPLTDFSAIHFVELDRLRRARAGSPPIAAERWQRFLAEGEDWNADDLQPLLTPCLEEALTVLHSYTTSDIKRREYENRQDFLRVQRTRELEAERAKVQAERLVQALATAEAERAAAEAERQAEDEKRAAAEAQQAAAEEKLAQLQALLLSLGVTTKT